MCAPGQQLLVLKNTLMFYTREVRTVLGVVVAGDLFMYYDGMSKICTAVVNISHHLEFSLGLQCERHCTHVE